jgi:AcrR family transcriptional regulator
VTETLPAASEAARSGRPRDPSRDEAIFAATLALFAEDGYAGVSIEGVAARAGVGKATIYRRYSSKAQLLVDAMQVCVGATEELPDTGDLRADLTTMLTVLMNLLRGDRGPVLIAFAAERIRYPTLDEEFKRSVIGA